MATGRRSFEGRHTGSDQGNKSTSIEMDSRKYPGGTRRTRRQSPSCYRKNRPRSLQAANNQIGDLTPLLNSRSGGAVCWGTRHPIRFFLLACVIYLHIHAHEAQPNLCVRARALPNALPRLVLFHSSLTVTCLRFSSAYSCSNIHSVTFLLPTQPERIEIDCTELYRMFGE